MTKGRSTTWQERIEIVLYCLANQHDYHKTAEQHKVSYQQVYQWVKKFEDGGEDALKDRRGKKKTPEELTEADLQRLEMKKMNRYQLYHVLFPYRMLSYHNPPHSSLTE
nr:helix-turn-helix domain-containing protein [Paenibacillus sp. F411]